MAQTPGMSPPRDKKTMEGRTSAHTISHTLDQSTPGEYAISYSNTHNIHKRIYISMTKTIAFSFLIFSLPK